MARSLCVFASDAKGRSLPGKGPPRTCSQGKGADGTVYERVDCRGCELYAPRDGASATGDGAAPAPRSVAPPGDCGHFRELSGAERSARGLDHRRRWGLCLHDERPRGETVCGCRGCNPTCPGYAPG